MKVIEGNLGLTFNIAIIVSKFNSEVTEKLLSGALLRLKELGFKEELITVVKVPGAIEIPIVAKRLAEEKKYGAIIALGAVIRGETKHFDYVCSQVSYGCQHVALTQDVPVIFGVLTTDTEEQAFDRAGGKEGNKGADAVNTASELFSSLEQLKEV